MSGGYFDYNQYRIGQIADDIENVIANNNVKDEYGYAHNFSDETIEKFKYAIHILRIGAIMVTRIDYLLSGDDGEESFHRQWVMDLKQ